MRTGANMSEIRKPMGNSSINTNYSIKNKPPVYFCVFFSFFLIIQFINSFFSTKTIFRYSLDIFSNILLPVVLIFVIYSINKNYYYVFKKEFKFGWVSSLNSIAIGFVLSLVYLLIYKYSSLFPSFLTFQYGSSTITGYAPDIFQSYGGKAIAWVALWIFPSFVEEFFYRTVLFNSFRTPPSKLMYFFISTFFFSIVHFEQGILMILINAVLFFLPASIFYYEEKKLGPLIIIHAEIDALTSIGSFFSQ